MAISLYGRTDSGGLRCRLDYNINTDNNTNKSWVNTSVYVENTRNSQYDAYGSEFGFVGYITIDGTSQYVQSARMEWIDAYGVVYVGSYSKQVIHNNDGTKSVYISTSVVPPGVGATITLPTVPRYPNFTAQNIEGVSPSHVWVRYVCDVDCGAQYSLNDGSWQNIPNNWTPKGCTFSLDNLTPGTNYNVKIKLTRQDNGLETISSYLGFTTSPESTCSFSNFNVDSSIPVTISRARDWLVHYLDLYVNGIFILRRTDIGASTTIVPTTAERQLMYNAMASVNSASCFIGCATYEDGVQRGNWKNTTDKTATITNANPIFSNFAFEDRDPTIPALSGSSQKIVINSANEGANVSDVFAMISVANKAVAQKGATIQKYTFVMGNKTKDIPYSATAAVEGYIYDPQNPTMQVYAVDSRGNSTRVDKVPTYKDYTMIKTLTSKASRDNGGIGTNITLDFNGYIWNDNFGSVLNSIVSCSYKYKKTTSSTWINGVTNITPAISGNAFSKSIIIQGDLGANGFDSNFSYDIQIIITDKLSSHQYNLTLQSGKPQLAFGVNAGVAAGDFYDPAVGGPFQINKVDILNVLNGKQAAINLTANRALLSDANGKVAVSPVTNTELNYLDGVTNNIQTQINNLNNKANSQRYSFSGTYVASANIGRDIAVNVPSTGMYIISVSFVANQGGYRDAASTIWVTGLHISYDQRSTWATSEGLTGSAFLNAGSQVVTNITINGNFTVEWAVVLTRVPS